MVCCCGWFLVGCLPVTRGNTVILLLTEIVFWLEIYLKSKQKRLHISINLCSYDIINKSIINYCLRCSQHYLSIFSIHVWSVLSSYLGRLVTSYKNASLASLCSIFSSRLILQLYAFAVEILKFQARRREMRADHTQNRENRPEVLVETQTNLSTIVCSY